MNPVSCINDLHGVTDLVNHGLFKIQKVEYLENRTKLFFEIKKIFNLCLT